MTLETYSDRELLDMRASLKNMIDEKDNSQQAIKILLNSAYGALGSPYFRFFNANQAEAITICGQVTIRSSEIGMNNYLNKLLGDSDDHIAAMDTDSIYVILDKFVDKFIPEGTPTERTVDMVAKAANTKFQKVLDDVYAELQTATNSKENFMQMKLEAIGAAVFVMKKRYIMKVYQNEGVTYAKPKAKVMGLESVRSTTPAYCRNKLKASFMDIFDLTQDEMIEQITQIKKEFMALPIQDCAMPIGVNDLRKYKLTDKNIPYNAKAALLYNNLLKEHGLERKYETIKNGDKVKIVTLKTPNPLHNGYIAFPSVLPEEFELDEYVDRKQLFDRNFETPLSRVLEVFGWKTEPDNSLLSMFT